MIISIDRDCSSQTVRMAELEMDFGFLLKTEPGMVELEYYLMKCGRELTKYEKGNAF